MRTNSNYIIIMIKEITMKSKLTLTLLIFTILLSIAGCSISPSDHYVVSSIETEYITGPIDTDFQVLPTLESFSFKTAHDFYLYAEKLEQDLSKYDIPPSEAPDHQYVERLIKIEQIFPEINKEGFEIRQIAAEAPQQYIYFCTLDVYVLIRDHSITSPPESSSTEVIKHNYFNCTTIKHDGLLYYIEFEADEDVWIGIMLPLDEEERKAIEESSVTCLKELMSNDGTLIAKQLAAISDRIKN